MSVLDEMEIPKRRFLVSCNGSDAKGNQVFLSFDVTVPKSSKMTSDTLRNSVNKIKEQQGYKVLVPLAFSEYDEEEE